VFYINKIKVRIAFGEADPGSALANRHITLTLSMPDIADDGTL
jgi:hypothetical protein